MKFFSVAFLQGSKLGATQRPRVGLRQAPAFLLAAAKHFLSNQGMLLAGAIAYYALLSVVPLVILMVVVLSHLVDQGELIGVLGRYLEWLVPSQSRAVMVDVEQFLEARSSIGLVLFGTLLFFSAMAFGVLEKAMAVIFSHRHAAPAHSRWLAMLRPYALVLLLGLAMLAVTVLSVVIGVMAEYQVSAFGQDWALDGLIRVVFYGIGFGFEVLVLCFLYLAIPQGKTRPLHALLGAVSASVAWELMRHLLVWYFATLSKVSVVYGSLTTAVVVMFSMEVIAIIVLYGAQVIADYEQLPPSHAITAGS